ncbi:MAG: DUF72 domain-containing protein [Actinomycetota bacterium]|nr:DUF72 domain-containing protein [Actinomycetota bacterium]
MQVHVGTSGWQYADWKERFYPKGLPQREWLPYFSERFPTVEVNNTFYMLPKPETFSGWRERSAEDFVFVVKASRYLTHIRRLRDCKVPLSRFWAGARRLGRKLGPVLFQLPPNFPADLDRLESFLHLLPSTMRPAFEFRHPSWDHPDVHRALDRAGVALVLPDRPGTRPSEVVTGGWTYVRFHEGRRSGPGYPRSKLARYADLMAKMDAREAWVFFNNDPQGAAIRDAFTFTELLEERGLRVRGPRHQPETPRRAG